MLNVPVVHTRIKYHGTIFRLTHQPSNTTTPIGSSGMKTEHVVASELCVESFRRKHQSWGQPKAQT